MTIKKVKKAVPTSDFHCRTCLGNYRPGDFARYRKGRAMCVYCKSKIDKRKSASKAA